MTRYRKILLAPLLLLLLGPALWVGHGYVAAPIVGSSGPPPQGLDLGGLPASSPAVAEDGSIYARILDATGKSTVSLVAVNPRWPPKVIWRVGAGTGKFLDRPAVGPDGTIYTSSADGRVFAVSPRGMVAWSFGTHGPIHDQPTIRADGTIYVRSDDGFLYALPPGGKLAWKYHAGALTEAAVAVDPFGTVYTGSSDGYLLALTPAGKLKWKHKLGGTLRGAPAVSQEDWTVYLVASDSTLYSISRQGALQWKAPVREAAEHHPIVRCSEMIYVASDLPFVNVFDLSGKFLKLINESEESAASRATGPGRYSEQDRILSDNPFRWRRAASTGIYGEPAQRWLSLYTLDRKGSLIELVLGVA